MWFHYRFIVVAQIGEHAFVAAWMLEHANALAVSQQALVKIVNGAGILREEGLQKGMGGIGCDFFADQPQTT